MNILQKIRLNNVLVILTCFLVIFTCGCGRNSIVNTAAGLYFDTYISLTSYDDTDVSVLEAAVDECARYELIFSKSNEESELYKINNRINNLSNDETYISSISSDMYQVLSEAIKYAKITSNAYNPALGTVIDLWDYHSDNPAIPQKDLVEEALEHTDVKDFSVYESDGEYYIEITDPRLKIDLGGIAKGYIANCIRDYLLDNGCKECVIALGGNIYCIGDKNGQGYNVGVQRPFSSRGDSSLSIKVSNTSVVTSGIYERYFEVDGQIYHHIISSKTGFPVDNDLFGVTVICEDSMRADVLSTAFICMGKEEALKYIDNQKDIKVIMNFRDGSKLEKGFD